jgi:integral membrane sensor domain MASE1
MVVIPVFLPIFITTDFCPIIINHVTGLHFNKHWGFVVFCCLAEDAAIILCQVQSHVTERLCASQNLLAICGKIRLLDEENSSLHIIMFT